MYWHSPPWLEIPGTDSALTWPNTLSSDSETICPFVSISHYISAPGLWRGKLRGYGNVKWRKCDGWQWYDFNDCVPSNIFIYTRNTSRIVRIVSVLGYQAFSGLRWQCLHEAPCLTVVNISLKGVTMPRVCWLLSRTIYDTCGSCGCVMTMSPGDSVADTSGPVDNGRGSHRDCTDRPGHYLLSNTNSWDFTQSLRSHRPLHPPSPGAELSVMVRRYTGNCF